MIRNVTPIMGMPTLAPGASDVYSGDVVGVGEMRAMGLGKKHPPPMGKELFVDENGFYLNPGKYRRKFGKAAWEEKWIAQERLNIPRGLVEGGGDWRQRKKKLAYLFADLIPGAETPGTPAIPDPPGGGFYPDYEPPPQGPPGILDTREYDQDFYVSPTPADAAPSAGVTNVFNYGSSGGGASIPPPMTTTTTFGTTSNTLSAFPERRAPRYPQAQPGRDNVRVLESVPFPMTPEEKADFIFFASGDDAQFESESKTIEGLGFIDNIAAIAIGAYQGNKAKKAQKKQEASARKQARWENKFFAEGWTPPIDHPLSQRQAFAAATGQQAAAAVRGQVVAPRITPMMVGLGASGVAILYLMRRKR